MGTLYRRPDNIMKAGTKKCHTCGKMATKPYRYTIVPSINPYGIIPNYNKNSEKTKRIDLKDGKDQFGLKIRKKVDIEYYCDTECHKKFTESKTLDNVKRGISPGYNYLG